MYIDYTTYSAKIRSLRYMDTVLKVLIHGGHYVRDDVVNSVTQSISESPEMYAFIGRNEEKTPSWLNKP